MLLNDPVGWTGTMVRTWLRFAIFALLFVGAIGLTVYIAAVDGWRAALAPAIFLAFYQIYFLYALRRLFGIVSHTSIRKQSAA